MVILSLALSVSFDFWTRTLHYRMAGPFGNGLTSFDVGGLSSRQ